MPIPQPEIPATAGPEWVHATPVVVCLLLSAALGGCTRCGQPPAPGTLGAAETASDDHARSDVRPALDQVRNDLALITSYNFATDHVGPDAHAAILARLRRHPGAYVSFLEERFRRFEEPPVAMASLGELEREAFSRDLPLALDLLYDASPERVRPLAANMLTHWRFQQTRTDVRVADGWAVQLALLRDGIDLPTPASFEPAMLIDHTCAMSTPSGRWVLRVRGCTCSVPIACALSRVGTEVHLRVVQDPRPGVCTDCLQVFTACTLPDLTQNELLQLVVNGVPAGRESFPAGVSILDWSDDCHGSETN